MIKNIKYEVLQYHNSSKIGEKLKMINNFTKIKIATITLILMLTFSATILASPIVSAHDPAWVTQSWSYVGVSPEVIGVGQEALIVFWPAEYPKTAQGMYGDRFTWTVDVTTPDGSVETLGPFTSDPVGGGWALYTPTQVGTYTIVSKFPGHTYTGLPDTTPSTIRSPESVGDTLLPSESSSNVLSCTGRPNRKI